jgi:uncharacterized protein (DUF1800 family)
MSDVRSGDREARTIVRLLITLLSLGAGGAGALAADLKFFRGDTNGDGQVNVSDAIGTFNYLFVGGAAVNCLDAADSNDDGLVNLSDGLYALNALFSGGPAIPAPGTGVCGLDPTPDQGSDLGCEIYNAPNCDQGPAPNEDLRDIGHVLNRIGYGPSEAAIERVQDIGITAYIQQQLNPSSIDDSALEAREASLFTLVSPSKDTRLVQAGSVWRYLKGTAAPPAAWRNIAFDDSSWAQGATSIGYGDDDDLTELADMQGSYASVFLRKTFELADPAAIAAIDGMILRVDYDDGFVAYLNGTEVGRRNLTGNPPAHTALATSHDAGTPDEIDITARKNLLVVGTNVLAVQVHNTNLTSSDLTINPELLSREILPGEPIPTIRGITELQQLVHIRGVYSERQLQAVLAEFWENHFTTDFDKVAEYLDALLNSDATDAMSTAEARRQAAQIEYEEYQFFHENALGNFGDLLLYSATSPAMQIYLDNVLNIKGAANENYAREIFELFANGVDNHYNQTDIEQLAKCFTGWTICKVPRDEALPFPVSANTPPAVCGVQYSDTVFLNTGAGWRYLKGQAEPTPDLGGNPTALWTTPAFDDTAWTAGSTGIGYGDGDDATTLSDMRNGYRSVYLRRKFNVADPSDFENLILEAYYDDGFVAYLNGVEIGRSANMEDYGSPPAFDDGTDGEGHEVTDAPMYINMNRFLGLLVPGPNNVLAVQVHNVSLDSSDLSMRPRLLDRTILGGVENGDPTGVWTFRFDPTQHDTTAKTLFDGTLWEINIAANQMGMAGLQDALYVVKALVDHPSLAMSKETPAVPEFICIKLIQKFVSDEITLANYKAGTAPPSLTLLLNDCITAWNSTTPRGNIKKVMEVILDPVSRASAFWAETNYRAKVKTPVEFINSSIRALNGITTGAGLPELNTSMGMFLFTRDEPDGWSELGIDWIDTGTMLERIDFGQALAENRGGTNYSWSTLPYLDSRGLDTAQEILDHFGDVLYQGTLSTADENRLLEFLTTNASYQPAALNRASATDFETRVEEFLGLMLSLPQWHFQ